MDSCTERHPQICPGTRSPKMIKVYILVLLLSISFTSGQRSFFNHQIVNRGTPGSSISFMMCTIGKKIEGPEIDPFWYLRRGARPIGRYGKRHLKAADENILRPGRSSLDLILTALREQEALGANSDGW